MKNRIVILGGGESGTGAAVLAAQHGFEVFVSDQGLIFKRNKDLLHENNVTFEEGGHSTDLIFNATEVIVSPGIPDDAPIIQNLEYEGIPMISEIEFACRYTKAKLIGITGTNGKTTTALLTYHLLHAAGLNVGLAGNVGNSFAAMVAGPGHDYYILELSSFQLDRMHKSKMDIAVLLNITPDHLDRYNNNFKTYIASKFRILQNMQKKNTFIYNRDDENINSTLEVMNIHSALLNIGIDRADNATAYAKENYLMFREGSEWKRVSHKQLPLQGRHNMMNTMASILIARTLDVSWESIGLALPKFRNIPHRLEYVDEIRGVKFYNDSKATNVDAVWYALESFDHPVYWIAGGIDKGNDYEQISKMVRKKVSALISLGTDNQKLHKYFEDYFDSITETDSMFRAVEIAYSKAKKGDVVLLSPACASFDLFKNYEARGEKFKEAVDALKNKEETNEKPIV